MGSFDVAAVLAVVLCAVAGGPWLARVAVRPVRRDAASRPTALRVAVTVLLLAALPAGALLVTGIGPAAVALAWAGAAAATAAAVTPESLGPGDVELLGLLGLLLGWVGWDVLRAGVCLGLLTGGVVSLAFLATRRAGRRTALPFGPPLLGGAVLALALGRPVPPG